MNKVTYVNAVALPPYKSVSDFQLQGMLPEDAKIGGEIGLHVVPNGTNSMIDMKVNRTLGCISSLMSQKTQE